MIDIAVNKLKKKYFANELFEELSLEIKTGEKIGILGENGTGKSTLFRILMGEEPKEGGDIFIRKNISIGLLRQMPESYPKLSVEEVLLLAFSETLEIKEKMNALEEELILTSSEENLNKYGFLLNQYEALRGYEIEEKLSKIKIGMKLDEEMLKKPYEVLSGGEKSRVLLAKILLEEPNVLLLDEPTNHLDIETTEWLEEYILSFPGSCLLISHDRYFLDKVVSKIYEIKNKKEEIYFGNYSDYLIERELRYEQEMKQYQQKKRKVEQLEKAAKRFREWGARADNPDMFVKAKAIEKRIERMGVLEKPKKDTKKIEDGFQMEKRASKEILVLKELNIKIGENLLFSAEDIRLQYGKKIALVGPNGCGKTTFFKKILEESNFSHIKLGNNISFGYIPQDVVFEQEEKNVLDVFRLYQPMLEKEARNYLAKFQFCKEEVFKRVRMLSGGERVRLKLAILMKQQINFLLLDEPTNHIDIKTREVLENAVADFEGSVLFISHDRYFLDAISEEILEIEDGKMHYYPFGYAYYKIEKQKRNTLSMEKEVKKKENVEIPKIKTTSISKNKWKIQNWEKEIQRLEIQIETIESDILKHQTEYEILVDLTEKKRQMEVELERILENWYEISQS